MARSTPTNKALPIHSPLILTLVLVAWLAVAVVSVVAGMCASRIYRRSAAKAKSSGAPRLAPPSAAGSSDAPGAALPTTSSPPSAPNGAVGGRGEERGGAGDRSPVIVMSKTRRLSASLSIMLREGLTRSRTARKEEEEEEEEESIWKKTIIMGERCRTPTDEDADMVVVCDEKGNRRKIFHPKTPRSLPASRTNSFADVNFRSSDLSSFVCQNPK